MQPIRLIIDDAPEFIQVPLEMQHHKIEVIIWPLNNDQSVANTTNPPIQDTPTITT